jgi:hypothetical protein
MNDGPGDGPGRLTRTPRQPFSTLLSDSALLGGDGQLSLLLDAAREEQIYPRLMTLGDTVDVRSLYQGDLGEHLAPVAPYLISLPKEQPAAHWFAEAGFGRSWGLFIVASVGLDELRRHLRKFNIVYRENGTPLVFRYYDPRVLRRFLPTCTSDELRRFFGPIDSFLVENEEADALLRFALRGGELTQTRLPLQG